MVYSELFDHFWVNGVNRFGNPFTFEEVMQELEKELRSVRRVELECLLKVTVELEEYELAGEIKRKIDGIQGK